MAETSVGRIVRIAGPVIDIEFPAEHLPEIYFALEIDRGLHRRLAPRDGSRQHRRSHFRAGGTSRFGARF